MASSPLSRIALFAGIALMGAVGGIYALRLMQAPASAPSAIPAPAPAPTAAMQPLPAASPAASPPSPPPTASVPTLNFQSVVQRYSLVQDGAAYVAASLQAPQLYPLKAGTGIISVARSDDGAWIVALTADGQAAYIPATSLGPFNASASPLATSLQEVSGAAQVVDTATLTVDGQEVSLGGVKGVTGDLATKLQQSIDEHGTAVDCQSQASGTFYLCKLADGVDVARLALFNGAAEPADDASDDYRRQADAARAARRGLWQSAAQ